VKPISSPFFFLGKKKMVVGETPTTGQMDLYSAPLPKSSINQRNISGGLQTSHPVRHSCAGRNLMLTISHIPSCFTHQRIFVLFCSAKKERKEAARKRLRIRLFLAKKQRRKDAKAKKTFGDRVRPHKKSVKKFSG